MASLLNQPLPFGLPGLLVLDPYKSLTDQQIEATLRNSRRPVPHTYSSNRRSEDVRSLLQTLDSLSADQAFNTFVLVMWPTAAPEACTFARSMLSAILRYPEVHWFLAVSPDQVIPARRSYVRNPTFHFRSGEDPLRDAAQALDRHAHGFRPLFDPTGMRHAVRLEIADQQKTENPIVRSHSAPYWAQSIAVALVKRATAFAAGARRADEALHAATLALEAWTLLDGATLALALEALRLVLRMEVTAECSFVGASGLLPVDARVREVRDIVGRLVARCRPAPIAPERPSDLLRPGGQADSGIAPGPATQPEANARGVLFEEAPSREAAVLDEEETFLIMNAYALYSRGYGVYLLPTLAETRAVLGDIEHTIGDPDARDLRATMEDRELRFGDCKPGDLKSLNLETRHHRFAGLAHCESAGARILVSGVDATHFEMYGFKKGIVKPYRGVLDPLIDAGLATASAPEASTPFFAFSVFGGRKDLYQTRARLALGPSVADRAADPESAYQSANAQQELLDEIRQLYRTYEQFDEEDALLRHVLLARSDLKRATGAIGRTAGRSARALKKTRAFLAAAPYWYFAQLSSLSRLALWSFAIAVIYSFAFAAIGAPEWSPWGVHVDLPTDCHDSLPLWTTLLRALENGDATCVPSNTYALLLITLLTFFYAHLAIAVGLLFQRLSRR